MKNVLVTFCVIVLAGSTFAQSDSNSRVQVKHGLDPDAAKIDLKPKDTTVEEILAQVRPDGLAKDAKGDHYENHRAEPFEKTVWRLKAKIVEIILRPDGDFYLVIEGASGARSVVEAPDPKLCKDSKLAKQIASVRKILADKFHPTAQPLKLNVSAQLTGVGFFGRAGAKGNGARLMPAIEIKFDQK